MEGGERIKDFLAATASVMIFRAQDLRGNFVGVIFRSLCKKECELGLYALM